MIFITQDYTHFNKTNIWMPSLFTNVLVFRGVTRFAYLELCLHKKVVMIVSYAIWIYIDSAISASSTYKTDIVISVWRHIPCHTDEEAV